MGNDTREKTLALVTGASRGIGRATAIALAEAGHHVFVNYARDAEGAAGTVRAIHERGGGAEAVCADIRDEAAVGAMFDTIEASPHGSLAVLVNNAGVTSDELVLETDLASWERLLSVNLGGAFLCARRALSLLLPRRYGRIVNVSSVMAERPNRGVASYAASKGGLNALTRALAVEVGAKNITVNAVAPGFVLTEMTTGYSLEGGARARRFPYNAVRRPGSAEEIAAVIRFLCSPEASFINGQVIVADGGPAPYSSSTES